MVTFLTVLHIIITISLIFLVLVQDSKGGGMGAFGGSGNSNTVLGATGATSLASKLTQGMAIAFGISCILLAIATGRSKKSVVDEMAPLAPPSTMAAGAATKDELPKDTEKKDNNGASKEPSGKVQVPNTTSEQKQGKPSSN